MSNDTATRLKYFAASLYNKRCEFLAIPLTSKKIADSYLRPTVVSCSRETEVSANFE